MDKATVYHLQRQKAKSK